MAAYDGKQMVKSFWWSIFVLPMLLVSTGLHATAAERSASNADAGPYISDSVSGFAIEGFDAVSYFVDHRAVVGRRGFETTYGGAYWRFANQGNADAFNADPDVFAPQFGGNCPVSLSRGVASAGDPLRFAIYKDRLYLFNSEGNRQVFLRDPEGFVDIAERKWQDIRHSLVRH